MAEENVSVSLSLEDGYRFRAEFEEGMAPLILDEPPPLGEGAGPNASRLLAAAVGNCLSASALFCLRKARIPVAGMRTDVEASLARNEAGRLRVAGLRVRIRPRVAEEDRDRMGRCLALFEDFCVVTQAVRAGLPVEVEVEHEGAPVGARADRGGGGETEGGHGTEEGRGAEEDRGAEDRRGARDGPR